MPAKNIELVIKQLQKARRRATQKDVRKNIDINIEICNMQLEIIRKL